MWSAGGKGERDKYVPQEDREGYIISRERGKGRYFKKDEEGVDWFGSRCLGEEEVLDEVSEWVQK